MDDLGQKESDSKENAAAASKQITSNQHDASGPGLPPVATPPQPAPTPDGEPTPDKKSGNRRDDLKLVFEGLGLVALIVYTVFSILQWAQIRWTNRLTREALNGNDSALRQNLGKLDWQIKETHEIAKQTLSQATQTQALAENAVESERPWMGSALQVTNFEIGKNPTYLVQFQNTGKRPVKTVMLLTLATHNQYGMTPRYPLPTEIQKRTVNFIVPGGAAVATWEGDVTVARYMIENGTTVYASLDYIDIRTKTRHWSHACWRYVPIVSAFLACQNSYTNAN